MVALLVGSPSQATTLQGVNASEIRAPLPCSTAIFINEFHYDNEGADADEFVEIAGPAGTSLSGWFIVLYNGNGGAPYHAIEIHAVIPDQDNGFGTLHFEATGLQNSSPDGLALVNPSNGVEQFLSYAGSFVAVGGLADGMTSTDVGVAESGDTPVGHSLQLSGTGQCAEDFVWSGPSSDSLGAVNSGQLLIFRGSRGLLPVLGIEHVAHGDTQ